MPAGRGAYTSTYALSNATMAYALEIADRRWRTAATDPVLASGVSLVDWRVTHTAVAAAHGLEYTPLETVGRSHRSCYDAGL